MSKQRKTGILIRANGNNDWIGGLYYCKNIAFQLSVNKNITDGFNIYLLTSPDNYYIFEDLRNVGGVKILNSKEGNHYIKKLRLLYYIHRYRIKFIFPQNWIESYTSVQTISWIADFQHNYLTTFFQDEEIGRRTADFHRIAELEQPLILSSFDCLKDFRTFYVKGKKMFV